MHVTLGLYRVNCIDLLPLCLRVLYMSENVGFLIAKFCIFCQFLAVVIFSFSTQTPLLNNEIKRFCGALINLSFRNRLFNTIRRLSVHTNQTWISVFCVKDGIEIFHQTIGGNLQTKYCRDINKYFFSE